MKAPESAGRQSQKHAIMRQKPGEMGETKGRQPEATVIDARPQGDLRINYQPKPEGKGGNGEAAGARKALGRPFKERRRRTRQGKDLVTQVDQNALLFCALQIKGSGCLFP